METLILILRNYKDVYISHNLRDIPLNNINIIYNKLYNFEDIYFSTLYFELIDFFDKYQGKKLLLYYEDIIKNNYIEIKKVFNLILPDIEFNEQQIIDLNVESMNSYKKTSGQKTEQIKDLHTIFTSEQNNKIDIKFRNFNKEIFDKYLNRYLWKNKNNEK